MRRVEEGTDSVEEYGSRGDEERDCYYHWQIEADQVLMGGHVG
jgi:hypothetical protein